MKRFFAIVLLFAVLAMNMDMICQSLCLAGHGDMAGAHVSHKTAKHETAQGEMCPLEHNADHNTSHRAMPQSSIKCDCSADQAASVGFEFTSAGATLDVTAYMGIVSRIHSQGIIFLSKETSPLEGPPKLIS
ncbi:MAG: hypothetical protein HZB81_05115 [Deltaproteobacteria bacterium]|nr:hypothetical protein [Deltaproteobacteria bacterium]